VGARNDADPSTAEKLVAIATVEQRESGDKDFIAGALTRYAAGFVDSLDSDEAFDAICNCALFCREKAGKQVVSEREPADFFFVVLTGSVMLEERTLHHREGLAAMPIATHGREIIGGTSKNFFHHMPLVLRSDSYGYSAKCVEATLLMKLRCVDYDAILRRSIERDMLETVEMISATIFFGSWSDAALTRLYFRLERRHVPAGENVMTIGDDADFCFFIRRGECHRHVVGLPPLKSREERATLARLLEHP
jgi:CRP-like cAMP-binding protein